MGEVTHIQKLKQALVTLHEILGLLDDAPAKYVKPLEDATVQRFEYCYDLLWKSLKDYLVQQHGLVVGSPKAAFRELEIVGVVTSAEYALLMNMSDSRNLTSHTYNEDAASRVFEAVPRHYDLMQQLAARICKD